MKIAIHPRPGSFSDRWIDYCNEKSVDYKIVNCYSSDIIDQLKDCDVLMWHYSNHSYKDLLFAKGLLFSLEQTGKKVFPDSFTAWHFDDKIGQKYLFESIDAPLVPTYVFYERKFAVHWAESTSFPKVFKLRSGSGSNHVKLVRSKKDAVRLINKAFRRGFSQFDKIGHLKERIRRAKAGKDTFFGVLKAVRRQFVTPEFARMYGREKGYVYFQDFIPDNKTDTRIVVTGNKIIGERRGVREGDFRASGSQILLPDVSLVDKRCVKIAYDITQLLKLQIGVFDFIHDKDNNPLITEVSFGTDPDYSECEGYWDENLDFCRSKIDLPQIIIESFLTKLNN